MRVLCLGFLATAVRKYNHIQTTETNIASQASANAVDRTRRSTTLDAAQT